MIRFVKPPFDPPKPNDLAAQLADAIRIAAADMAGRKETGLGHVIAGCDGYPIVTIGDGTTCHDTARASQGGALVLTADLGGSRATLQANLGRSQSPNSGYAGAGMSSGAIPPPLDAGAADISLDPIDLSTTLVIDVSNPITALIGATIAGKTGDSKRLAVCYDTGGAGIWDDILTGSETAVTGLSIDPNYIGAIGGDVYYLTRLYAATVSRVESGAESSTSALPSWTGGGYDYAFSALALSYDRDTAAVAAPNKVGTGSAIYIGTSMLTSPSWTALAIPSSRSFQVYGTRQLWFDQTGRLYVAAITDATDDPVILVINPPYSAVSETIAPSWLGSPSAGEWNAPSPLALSRDGVYLAAGVHTTSGIVDIVRTSGHDVMTTLTAPGYTLTVQSGSETGYGGIAWGPDGRVFAVVRKTADGSYHLAVWTRAWGAPEIIDLSIASTPSGYDWVSVSGDGEVVAVRSWTDELKLVEPPYTAAGATVTTKTMTADILYQFEFDPSEVYQDSSDLTLSASVTSVTPSGSALEVVTRLSWAAAAIAWAVTITVPLPEGSTFVSATDDGWYDAETGLVTWFVGTVAASSSGYVEVTTRVGA